MRWVREMKYKYGYIDTCSSVQAYQRDKMIGTIVIISSLAIIMTIVGVK